MLEFDTDTEALRARLAQERLLTHQRDQLASANSRISEKAKILSTEVIEKREAAEAALMEANQFKTRTHEALRNLRKARGDVVMAERRLWASIETIEDGFAVFDRDRKVIAANRAFLLPFADMECVDIGISHSDLIDIAAEEGLIDPGDRSPAEWAHWMKSRWDADEIDPVVIRFWDNSFVRMVERRTDDGDMVVLGSNITPTMRRQRALEFARHRAEAANRAKSNFLANMSHEIRTPMNGVLAMADILAEGALSEEQRLCVDTIKSSGEALLVIINDVLDYSKIEAQKLELNPAPFDLEETINEVVTLLQPAAREKDLSLVVDYDMFLPTRFTGDKGRIRQILMNLVGNAVKFTPDGHVLIRVVGLSQNSGESYRLHVTVEDTGIGIEPDMRAHIFGEFNQAQSDRTRQFDGTGLGLAITQRLVKLMDGDVWVESEIDAGSVFGFSLVMSTGGASQMPDFSLPTSGRRVLLCDPDAASRAILSKQLMALGLRPECHANASDAALQGAGPEDLVILTDSGINTGTIRIGLGLSPDGEKEDTALHTLARPILRGELLSALDTVLGLPVSHEPAVQDHQGHRLRVLAAEDNKTNQLVFRKLLKDQDIDLTMVENGREAVQAFEGGDPPDILFTDISMPVMDGKDAARAIREIEFRAGRARIPIVAMTAHALEGDEDSILAAGIDHYMTKPLRKEVLIARLDEVRMGQAAAAPVAAQ